jgi:HK97 family phage major capsid protein
MTLEEMLALIDALLSNPEATPEEMAQVVQQIREGLAALVAEAGGDQTLTEEALSAVADGITAIEEKMNKVNNQRAKVKAFLADNARKVAGDVKANNIGGAALNQRQQSTVPAAASRVKSRVYNSNEDAYKVGMFFKAISGKGSAEAESWLRDRGFEFKTLTSANNSSAGILAPDELNDAIIKLRAQYGVSTQLAQVIPTNLETYRTRKIVSGNAAYAVVEGTAVPTSDPVYKHIQLTPKLWGARTQYYSTLGEDSIINLVDELTEEHGRAHAVKQDEAYFNGDGTSAYAGILGVTQVFKKLVEDNSGTWTDDADKAKLGGAVVASGTSWSTITDDDISKLIAAVENYPGQNLVFTCTNQFYWEVLHTLAINAGGTPGSEVLNGIRTPFFYGYPVVINNAMAKVTGTDQVPLLFGDFTQGSIIVDRRGATIETDKNISTQVEEVVSTMRYDVLVHDFGNYNATAANRTRGAIAALITQNS